jgi:hypothetical protein
VFNGGGVLSAGFTNTIQVTAAIPTGMTGHLDAWLDINRDGKWQPNEKLSFTNNAAGLVQNGLNTLTFTFGNNLTPHGASYIRFRLTSAGISTPTGVAPDGEVEDYKVTIGGAPFQNPIKVGDVNNDGVVAPQDAVIIILYLNGYGATALQLGQPPIPNPFGGGPGRGLYVDVDGDGILAPKDLQAIISILNGAQSSGGEGESAGTASLASASNAQSTASPIIPPVLYASSSVVIDASDASAELLPATRPANMEQTVQDAALLALANSDDASTPLDRPERRSEDGSDEANWDDLLGSLATEQEDKR